MYQVMKLGQVCVPNPRAANLPLLESWKPIRPALVVAAAVRCLTAPKACLSPELNFLLEAARVGRHMSEVDAELYAVQSA